MLQRAEKIILGLIIGILGIHLIMQVMIPVVHSQTAELKPIPVYTIEQNATGERRIPEGPEPPIPATVQNGTMIPERQPVESVLRHSLDSLGFAMLVTFSAIGVFLPWAGVLAGQLPNDPAVLAPMLFFWVSAMGSIPIMILKLSKTISWLRLGLYLYVLPSLIGGIGIIYFTNFGA